MKPLPLVIVTGKGGVGKSTVAASLAAASAALGMRTALAALDRPDPALQLPGVESIHVDPFDAVREYVHRNFTFTGLYDRLFESRAFRDFAAAAPGFEDLMCLGKLYDLATHGRFDRVVFDAPATGHVMTLLDVPNVALATIRGGPLHANALKIRELLLDRARTAVVIVTLAEEMPVAEALDLERHCRERLAMRVAPMVVNRALPDRFGAGDLALLRGVLGGDADLGGLLAAVEHEHEACMAQRVALADLESSRLPLVRVPQIVQPQWSHAALVASMTPHLHAVSQAL